MKVINGIIKSVDINTRECGSIILNIELNLSYGRKVIFGGTKLGSKTPCSNAETKYQSYMAWYISKFLQIAEVESLNDAVGKPVRVIFNSNEVCIGIQHFLDDGVFFIPRYINDYSLDFSGLFEYEEQTEIIRKLSSDEELYESFRWMQTIEEGKKLFDKEPQPELLFNE